MTAHLPRDSGAMITVPVSDLLRVHDQLTLGVFHGSDHSVAGMKLAQDYLDRADEMVEGMLTGRPWGNEFDGFSVAVVTPPPAQQAEAAQPPKPAPQAPLTSRSGKTMMSCLLDADDELAVARDLVELINMTGRKDPDDDEKAIGAGCQAALEKIASVRRLLEEARAKC